jgi:DNA mismatch repair protein MutS2
MTDADTLRRLEYPRVRELLAERTAFEPSRELADALVPATDEREAERLQDETAAARLALRNMPSLSIAGARDIRAHVRRAALGGSLDPRELLEIADTIRAAIALFAALDDPRYAALAGRARFVRPPRAVAELIEHAIGPTAEVLDRASATLATLRNDLRAAQARLQQRLDQILRSPELAPFLQEAIVTQRNGRYVVPIRAQARSQVRGVVHDQSASGQTLFVEPLEILDLGNRVREIALAEQQEVERILLEISSHVAREAEELDRTIDAVAYIDLVLAKAHLAEGMDAARPHLAAEPLIDLIDARHPLLGDDVVPISVAIGDGYRALVVTGPNTGGKTVTLKTTGLLALMAAAGLQLPASERSRVPVFRRVFADIGDEQSIQQSLSTFSSHLRNVVTTLKDARAGDLVLLDEIGAGTDPDEGAALAMAVLSTLLRREVLVAATTHYPELKAFALTTPGARNASVEFDTATLRPTYRLRIGLPGASQAFAIAERLGLDRAVLDEAEGHLSELHRTLERTLREAEAERHGLALERERLADTARAAAGERERGEVERRRMLEDARAELERARREADEIVLQARRALRAAEEARQQSIRRNLVEEARAALDAAERERERDVPTAPIALGEIEPGADVFVGSSTEPARLIRIDERGIAEVEAGSARMRVPAEELRPAPRRTTPTLPEAPPRLRSLGDVPAQLDLRGARAEEALEVLDRYLNDASLAGLTRARVVHGKGTGALRAAVREHLTGHPLVKSSRAAPANEGGDGATIVEL